RCRRRGSAPVSVGGRSPSLRDCMAGSLRCEGGERMKLGSHTVLVTGGASGIGLALATRFLDAGSDVVICGRREDKLREAKAAHPKLRTRVCDVARDEDREALIRWMAGEFAHFDVLVNNAGIQRRVQLAAAEPWKAAAQEIAINFEAPVHLSRLVIPHFMKQPYAAIVNITSGLAFAPLANVP